MSEPQDPQNPLDSSTDHTTLVQQLENYQQHLAQLPADASELERARVRLDIAETHLAMEQMENAWNIAREAVNAFIQQEQWQLAAEAYNVLFQTDQPASLSALGQGVWLAVTFPIEPNTSVALLQHIVDETPNDSDGGAVAAIAAHYIADIRCEDDKRESLTFLTQNILGKVAKHHSNINTQAEMDQWLEKLELKDPQTFLPRLGIIIDVMVEDDWWFDRDSLREKLPVH